MPLPLRPASFRDAIELLTVVAAIEAALWTEGALQKELAWVAGGLVLLIASMDRRSWSELGIRRPEGRSFTVVGWAVAVAAAMVTTAWWFGTLHGLFGPRAPLAHTLAYVVWAISQQFILQAVVFVRFEACLRDAMGAALASGVLFGLLHIPNPVLMLMTACGGFLLCLRFRRDRDVLTLGIAHFLVGIALAISVPDALMRHMRVGLGYHHFVH